MEIKGTKTMIQTTDIIQEIQELENCVDAFAGIEGAYPKIIMGVEIFDDIDQYLWKTSCYSLGLSRRLFGCTVFKDPDSEGIHIV